MKPFPNLPDKRGTVMYGPDYWTGFEFSVWDTYTTGNLSKKSKSRRCGFSSE